MLNNIFVTKLGMTQAWTSAGKRLPITRCKTIDNLVLSSREITVTNRTATTLKKAQMQLVELGHGDKKQKNMSKPLRSQLAKSGFTQGVRTITGVQMATDDQEAPILEVGKTLTGLEILHVGDIVTVRGVSKGKGFAGAVKRYGFAGGPKTHGQSDRERAVGSIGAGTTPGRVWKGKKMPGRMGTDKKAITGLVVVHVDSQAGEVWLSGPVPGSYNSSLQITRTGKTKSIELNKDASGIKAVLDEKVETIADQVKTDDSQVDSVVTPTETDVQVEKNETKVEVSNEVSATNEN